ncbi:MAG: hypothetical protein KC457_25920, partial [Myxococcales bacterium]|nr:hypothetical protein [Myxococcales bacterium]
MADSADAAGKPKRMRMGVLVRLAIYVPLLGFFGWRAWDRFQVEREASDQEFRTRIQDRLQQPPQVIMLPNGESMQVITPEQAA